MTQETKTETLTKQQSQTVLHSSLYDRMHLRMISIMHDTLYGVLVNPYRWLSAAGLGPGQTVVEVGCGPGFFTIPAAEIIGSNGYLHSLDINPAAVNHVRRKVEERGLSNVDLILANAADSGIPNASVDVAFLFGVLRSIGDLDAVLREMRRVLKANGVLAVEKSSWSEARLLDNFTKDRLFDYSGKDGRICKFIKTGVDKTESTVSRLSIRTDHQEVR